MRSLCLLLGVALLTPGCTRNRQRVVVHPVQGQVRYAGQPAEGVRVYFYPMEAPSVPDIPSNPRALTDTDGRFTLTTFVDGDGAAEGDYLVILSWPEKSDGDSETRRDRLLGWYDAAHTKLRVAVKSGDNAIPAFEIAAVSGPPPKSEGIPGRN